MNDSKYLLSKATVALHWSVAFFMIVLLALGLYMSEYKAYSLYGIHKSLGIVILLLVVPRILYRLRTGWPEAASNYTKMEELLSRLVHYVLIVGTLIMPISGMAMSAFGGHGIFVFGIELLPLNLDPSGDGKVIPIHGFLAGLFSDVHEVLAYLLLVSLALHVIGALKHHFIDKDGTLRRMLGKRIS
ncbi:MAG: cytochrome b [Cellvibrionaceae bacterium]|nr:cytochrome b [Cellvibrionaceae bacterium]